MFVSNPPLVSIITPVYNGADFIEELIISVQQQDYTNIEHIVIDDGSTDNGATLAILKRFPHIRFWTRENLGQYATMNEGIREAKGEIVCFISADDRIPRHAVSTVMNYWIHDPAWEAFRGFSRNINANGTSYAVQNPIKKVPAYLYGYIPHIPHCVIYVKLASLLKYNLLFDEELHYTGDYDWTLRLIRSGLRMDYINSELAQIRVHPKQASVRHEVSMTQEKLKIMDRYGINVLLNAFIHTVLTFHSAGSKIIYVFKREGASGVCNGVKRWFLRKNQR